MNDYYKNCAFPKPETKKKEREKVSEETYNRVFNICEGRCVLCGAAGTQEHHIRYRSERRDLIDEPTNLLLLCANCHLKVHSNKKYWQPILLELAKEIYKNGGI